MRNYDNTAAATEAIHNHIAKNPLLYGYGYCLNDRFAEDYAYADSTLKYVYSGTVEYMNEMVNDWPCAHAEPLVLTLNQWLAIIAQWGTSNSVIESGALSSPRIMWQMMGDFITDDEAIIPLTKPEEQPVIHQLVRTESEFLRKLCSQNTGLFSGTLALAVKSITDKGGNAPLLHWLCYLSISSGAARTLVDAMIPPVEAYVCMDLIYNLINE